MPQIKINEVDTSTTSGLATTTNAAYVPGYAIMGPINTPTLCESVDEFERIFGSTPYYFEADQTDWFGGVISGDTLVDAVIRKGTAEKSYIYAHELLSQGLPVLFERVFDENKAYKAQTTLLDAFTSVAHFENTTYYKSPANDPGAWDVIPDWNASTVYALGDLVVSDMSVYRSLADGNEGNAVTDAEFWDRIEITDEAIWNSTTEYLVGDIVVASGVFYVRKSGDQAVSIPGGDKIKLSSTYPGKAAFLIKAKIEPLIAPNGSTYYKLSVGRDEDKQLRVDRVDSVTTLFTFNYYLSQTSDIPYYSNISVDKSGLVAIDWDLKNEEPVFALDSVSLNKNVLNESVTEITVEEFAITDIYGKFDNEDDSTSIFDKLIDKGEYVFKFLTSGAYPVFGYDLNNTIANSMITVASRRGDITALVDVFNENKAVGAVWEAIKLWDNPASVANVESEYGSESAFKYGAVIYPYGIYTNNVIRANVVMPGSFGYLSALAVAVQSNPNYYAVAGTKRGNPQKLIKLCVAITNAEAEAVQPEAGISINPITNIKPYGLLIWGNRTLYDSTLDGGLKASSFLNVRQLANDIKRTAFVASRELTFEQNNDILWINFKSKVTPLLDQMVSNGGIGGYELKRIATTRKATLKARIKVFATEAVENFDLLLDISDNVLTVAE